MRNSNIDRRRVLCVLAGAAATLPLPGRAQKLERPVRLIVPNTAASGIDAMARVAVPALAEALGQSIIIDNLAGAGGITGTSTLVKAAPDGHTLAMVSSNHVINPSIYARLPFDPIEDVTPISVLGESPMVLLVNPSVPATNLQQLLALLKAKPDAYNYATSGNGSIYHLATELMLDQAGVKAKHIPYRGTAPQLTAVVSGEVHFAIAGMSSSVAHMKSGAVRAIGVCGAARVPAEASLPNLAEQGLTDYSMEAWFAIIGPAKMPAAVVRHINEGVVAAYRRQDVVEAISKKGGVLKPGTSQDAAAFFRSERRRYAEIAKRANITLT